MSQSKKRDGNGDESEESPTAIQTEQPECGIIMPISQTTNHSEEHWRDVQLLLHRAVSSAGFTPRNVWENTSTDRVSERIIGNIFEAPLAVADISDLNPNVMLELGLRLASKKPTVVVSNAGGTIPFDIRDFHAVFYPADLNMLGMEDFFKRLGKNLKEKYAAFTSDSYLPFLSGVIVDVASPETREVGVNELIISRLEDLSDRLGRVETSVRRPRSNAPASGRPRPSRYQGTFEFKIPVESYDSFVKDAVGLYEVDDVEQNAVGSEHCRGKVEYSDAESVTRLYNKLAEFISKYKGELEIPF